MHVLTILDHPDPSSFSAAVATQFMQGARDAGHTTELADLHQKGFNPIWTLPDIAAYGPETMPTDVRHEQHRIERADAICLVFPLFWWGMPAMMKGWIDRVWAYGWAYDQLDDREGLLQRSRSGVLLVPTGGRSDEMKEAGYLNALETSWMQGTFGYFGFSPRQMHLLYGSTGSDARRKDLLSQSYQAGLTLAPPAEVSLPLDPAPRGA